MYTELQEIIDLIKIEEKPLGREDQIKVKMYMSGDQILDLCEGLAELMPYSREGWDFYYNYLSEEELFKIYYLLDRFSSEEEVSTKVRLACSITSTMLLTVLGPPCKIATILDESNKGYLDTIESVLDFYLPMEEFDEAHEKTHAVTRMLATHIDIGGFTHTIRKN